MKDLKAITFQPQDNAPTIIAGPCSAESRTQVLTTAMQLHDAGIKIFRAGVWKPRTKPGGFEGIGSPALEWLAEAKERTGMRTATEVPNREHVHDAISADIDILWIGARTSANPFAVQEIADTLAGLSDDVRDNLCVLVKNPVNPDLELWIGALERIYNAGISRMAAIHRGYSAYGEHLYRNPPLWRIPIELHRRIPELPILCDPSHIGGKREFIAPLCHQALEMNFDGLMIECHCEPEKALSDAAQQITPSELERLLRSLPARQHACGQELLLSLREQVDSLDSELLELLAQRMDVTDRIGRLKRKNAMTIVQPGRYDELMHLRVEEGESLGLNSDFVKALLAVVHEESVRRQLSIAGDRK